MAGDTIRHHHPSLLALRHGKLLTCATLLPALHDACLGGPARSASTSISTPSLLLRVPPKTLAEIAEAATCALAVSSHAGRDQRALALLLDPVATRLQGSQSSLCPSLEQRLSSPPGPTRDAAISELQAACAWLTGVARAVGKDAHRLVMGALRPFLAAFQARLHAAAAGAQPLSLSCCEALLRVFVGVCHARLPYLSEPDTRELVELTRLVNDSVLRLCARVLGEEAGAMSASASRGGEQLLEERAGCLTQLLELQGNLICKKPFNRYEGPANFDFVELRVLEALGALSPALDESALAFAKVSQGFFALLQIVTASCPERLKTLTQPQRLMFCEALRFALRSPDPEVLEAGLQTVEQLLAFHLTQPAPTPFASELSVLLPALLSICLLKHSTDTLGAVAGALYPLVFAERKAFESCALQFVREHARDEDAYKQLMEAFNTLCVAGDVLSGFSETHVTQFKANLRSFVARVRGLLERR
jgi:hypothetical protein